MNDHDLDSLRLLMHQQHEQRLREAGAGRLVRGLHRPPPEWPQLRAQRRAAIAPVLQTRWKRSRFGAVIAFLARVARAA